MKVENYLEEDVLHAYEAAIIEEEVDGFISSDLVYLQPDEDLRRAISLEDFSRGAKEHLRKLYQQSKK